VESLEEENQGWKRDIKDKGVREEESNRNIYKTLQSENEQLRSEINRLQK
jgi:hypothetical protein